MATRTAEAEWQDSIQNGIGMIALGSGAFKGSYSFSTRFRDTPGTNPEELIAAAHAGCFSMALSAQLAEAGLVAQSIQTKATVTLEKSGGGFAIPALHLALTALNPGASQQAFETAAENAKTGCPVSKLLNATITLDKKLEA